MPRSTPCAELAARVKADSIRRERIAAEKQAIEDALSLVELCSRQNVTQQKGYTRRPYPRLLANGDVHVP